MGKNTLIGILKESLVGKKIKHINQYGRTVSLEVEDVKVVRRTRQITPDTRENDWWGESCSWNEIIVYFIDGSSREFEFETEFEIE